jgi:hypothetical protein
MPVRRIEAGAEGAVLLETVLLGRDGEQIMVKVDPTCTRAYLELSTDDATGPAADAVNRATLSWNAEITPEAMPTDASAATDTREDGFVRGLDGGHLTAHVEPLRNDDAPRGSAVSMTAVVPPGSMVDAQTEGSDLHLTHSRVDQFGTLDPDLLEHPTLLADEERLAAVSFVSTSGELHVVDARSVFAEGRGFYAITNADTVQVVAHATPEVRVREGEVWIGDVRDTDVNTVTGDVTIGHATGHTEVNTPEGNVRIGILSGPSSSLRTGEGSVSVNVTAGRHEIKTGSGRVDATIVRSADATTTVTAVDHRGPLEVTDLRGTPADPTGGAGAAAGAAAAGAGAAAGAIAAGAAGAAAAAGPAVAAPAAIDVAFSPGQGTGRADPSKVEPAKRSTSRDGGRGTGIGS